MWCSDLFNELIPLCSGCQSPFDMRCCSPQVLPCSHTLCLSCATTDSKVRKSGKRRCPTCDKRYTSFHLNTALGETIDRIRVRREALESQSRRCDECDKRAYLSWMRRCITCEIQLKEAQLSSVICMECCVDRHNGHALRVVTTDPYAIHKDEKLGPSISICGSTSSTQYRSNVSNHSSNNSPCMHSTTRLHSTSSASSGISSAGMPSPGGFDPIDTRTGITQKVSSFLSRVTTRSGSLPRTQSPSRGKITPIPPPFPLQSDQRRKNSPSHPPPPPPTMNAPVVPTQSIQRRGTIGAIRPAMGTLSPYMVPNSRGMLSLKKSLDDLDDCMPKGDILREETSPFYEGHSMYGMTLVMGGSSSNVSSSSIPSILPPSRKHSQSSSRPLSEVRMESKRASLPLTDGEGIYHRLSPFPARRSPLLLPYAKKSIVYGTVGGTMRAPSPLANLANMPRRDPRIRGGPAYLHDVNSSYYENHHRLSFQSSISSNGGERKLSTVERRDEKEEEDGRAGIETSPSAATFFDKHKDYDKQLAVVSSSAAAPIDDVSAHYINVTRSCENLPSQFSSLDLNNNDGAKEGARRALRFPLKSRVINKLSDHCCSYEYIGS